MMNARANATLCACPWLRNVPLSPTWVSYPLGKARINPSRSAISTALHISSRLAPGLDGGTVYTDDRAPVEGLSDSSIVRYAAGR